VEHLAASLITPEHKVPLDHVEQLLAMLPDDFPVCACAADVHEARALAALNPTYIAVEPPELIGGDISVTTAGPFHRERHCCCCKSRESKCEGLVRCWCQKRQ
jgi:hypothetical protein